MHAPQIRPPTIYRMFITAPRVYTPFLTLNIMPLKQFAVNAAA